MGEEIVKVTIAPDGKVELRVEGMAGMGCLEETADLVRLLGGEVEAQEMTAEAYVEGDVEQRDQVWQ
jgi:hypothetical protein